MEERKVVLVTGGTRGIGKEIAKEFANMGYDVIINFISDNTDIKALEEEFSKLGSKAIFIKADVSDFTSCEKMVKEGIEAFGRIDVLINNAGITKDNLLMRMKEDEFDKVIDINLKGVFNVTKQVIPYMLKKREGNIINLSSVVGICGNAGQCNYSASKAGIIGFTKSLAKEVASRNIRVNAVAPGFIATDMTEVLNDTIKEAINTQIPLKRMGEAKEVAKVVKFLASDDASYITGQVINIDGGMVM
ncbi:MAG: 3-oxoacyl-[acyl-carrier-protein] reductase [Clostridia bacterium]|nr:3-oxoacyl-[acyl-carrier-protein] reductase [Clostridia bacterium]